MGKTISQRRGFCQRRRSLRSPGAAARRCRAPRSWWPKRAAKVRSGSEDSAPAGWNSRKPAWNRGETPGKCGKTWGNSWDFWIWEWFDGDIVGEWKKRDTSLDSRWLCQWNEDETRESLWILSKPFLGWFSPAWAESQNDVPRHFSQAFHMFNVSPPKNEAYFMHALLWGSVRVTIGVAD